MSKEFNSLYPTIDYICNKEKEWSWNGCDINVWKEKTEEELIKEVKEFMDDILEK